MRFKGRLQVLEISLEKSRRSIRGIRKIILVLRIRLFWKNLEGRRRFLLPNSCILIINWRRKVQGILFGGLFHFCLSYLRHFGWLLALVVFVCLRLVSTLFSLITLIDLLTRNVDINVAISWTRVLNILIHLIIFFWEWAVIMKSILISIFLLILCSFRVFWFIRLFVFYMA